MATVPASKLYVVIAAINNRVHLERLLLSLVTPAERIPMRIVVVDNGSTDGTAEWLVKFGVGVQLISNEGNLGAAVAWNQGIRFALANMANGCGAILVAGSDTLPMPGCVERLWNNVINEGILFTTGRQVPYDTPEAPCGPAATTEPMAESPDFSFFMFSPLVVRRLGEWDAAVELDRRIAWSKQHENVAPAEKPPLPIFQTPWCYGLFDERYATGYFEDNDLHTRMKHAGLLAVQDPGAVFRHDCSLTLRTNPEVAAKHTDQFRRNAELFRWKWGGLPHEVGLPQARPGNVTDDQWLKMSGGRPVTQVDRDAYRAQCTEVYTSYGLKL